MSQKLLTALTLFLLLPCVAAAPRPNVLYILCDDLGYGDVRALNPARCKIATPHIDRLVVEGMTFTDAHSASAVCTPSRYAILTGRYAWRTRLQNGVLNGDSPPLIARERLTVAKFLQDRGYDTAAVGKWHLGVECANNKWTDALADGPLDHGFTSFFGVAASLDMPPFAFIEDRRFTQAPTVEKTWLRTGPAAKDFEAVDVLPQLAERAAGYIKKNAGKPFLLYFALTSPHTPILPTAEWQGKSGLGRYGDFVMQTDAAVGRVLQALDAAGVAENTLVIFTSDNGCSPAAGVKALEAAGHFASADYRGYKADVWEGGHRVPFIVRWPGVIKPGSRNDALVCQSDLLATCVELLGGALPANAGEDSVSMLPLLTSRVHPAPRTTAIHHSIQGKFAIRSGRWKLALCPGSGGWAAPRDAEAVKRGLLPVQLYDIAADPGEQRNVAAEHPDVLRELTDLLQLQVCAGRSSPGPAQRNDVEVTIQRK